MSTLAVEKVKERKLIPATVLDEDPKEDNRAQLDPIVREVPSGLWDSIKDKVSAYLEEELSLADGERSGYMRDLARWKIAYAAPMATEPKDFPIANSSNLILPAIK